MTTNQYRRSQTLIAPQHPGAPGAGAEASVRSTTNASRGGKDQQSSSFRSCFALSHCETFEIIRGCQGSFLHIFAQWCPQHCFNAIKCHSKWRSPQKAKLQKPLHYFWLSLWQYRLSNALCKHFPQKKSTCKENWSTL